MEKKEIKEILRKEWRIASRLLEEETDTEMKMVHFAQKLLIVDLGYKLGVTVNPEYDREEK